MVWKKTRGNLGKMSSMLWTLFEDSINNTLITHNKSPKVPSRKNRVSFTTVSPDTSFPKIQISLSFLPLPSMSLSLTPSSTDTALRAVCHQAPSDTFPAPSLAAVLSAHDKIHNLQL